MMKFFEQRLPWNLNWNLLRVFMVIVEQGSITKAADFLGVRQPTISNSLKRLEQTLKRKLVDRRPTHFKVTDAGYALYAECLVIFRHVSKIPNLIGSADTFVSGHIMISMASHVISPHLDFVIETFNEKYPNATYSISITESSDVMRKVIQDQVTLGACLINNKDSRVHSSALYREFFGLYCGSKHRLFGKKNIDISELEMESVVSFQTDVESGPLHAVTSLRNRAKLNANVKGVSANLTEVRRMISLNLGVGALPIHIAKKDVEAGILWQLPPYQDLAQVDIFAITNPKRSLNKAEEVFLKILEDYLSKIPLSKRSYY